MSAYMSVLVLCQADELWSTIGRRVLAHNGTDVYQTVDSTPLLTAADLFVIVFGDGGNATLALTTKLTTAHAQLQAKGYRIGVFFAGDSTAEYFQTVWGVMEWPALQDKQYTALKTTFEPSVLPAVYLLDKGGDVIEPDGRALADAIISGGAAAFTK